MSNRVTVLASLIVLTCASAAFANTDSEPQFPVTVEGMRGLIGVSWKPECHEIEEMKKCWSASDRHATYTEHSEHAGWRMTCKITVTNNKSFRYCSIIGKSIFIKVNLENSIRNYKFYPRGGGSDLHADRPIYVTIDGVQYVSPVDSEYGKLELETEDGDELGNIRLITMIGDANRITTISWDANDQKYSRTGRGAGFSQAHDAAIRFLEQQ